MTGKITCGTDAGGGCRLRLLACNGQVILVGRKYRNRADCLRGVEAVRRRCVDAAHFEECSAPDGSFHFALTTATGGILGTSRNYASRAACRRGVASVQRHVAEARLVDAAAPEAGST